MSKDKGHITRVGGPEPEQGPDNGITRVAPTRVPMDVLAIVVGDEVQFSDNAVRIYAEKGSGHVTQIRHLSSGQPVPGFPKGAQLRDYVFCVVETGAVYVWSDHIQVLRPTGLPVQGEIGGITRAS